MSPRQIKAYLRKAIVNHRAVMIKGAPGLGKTDIVHAVCKELGADMIISHAVTDNPTNYKGLGFPDETKKFARFLPYDQLEQAIKAKKLTVWFFDDFGQALPAVQAAAMQLFLARTINGHKISPHVVFVICTNRLEDKAHVQGIIAPCKGRVTIVELKTDVKDWIEWAEENGVSPEMIAFIQWRPKFLHDFAPSLDLNNYPNPRNIVEADNDYKMGLDDDYEHEVLAGRGGDLFATEYRGFLRVWRGLQGVNPDVLLLDPSKFTMPAVQESVAVLWALARALSARATKQTMPNLVALSEMLPREYGTLMMTLIERTRPELMSTAAYTNWAVKNGKTTFAKKN